MERQKTVGLENVRSKTTQGQVPVPHPWEERNVAMPEEEPLVDSEVEQWIHGTEAPAETDLLVEPQKKDMRVQEVVHLAVKAYSARGKDNDFGYIITDSE